MAPPLRNIVFHIVKGCNLKCKVCYGLFWSDKKQLMNFQIYKKSIDEAYSLGLQSIRLSGYGEPSLHPELKKMILYAKNKKLYIRIYTNLLMHRDLLWFVINNADLLSVHVNAFSKNLFLESQVRADEAASKSFELFARNIAEIRNTKNLDLIFVINNRNILDLHKVVYFCLNTKMRLQVNIPIVKNNAVKYICFSSEELKEIKRELIGLYIKTCHARRYDLAFQIKKVLFAEKEEVEEGKSVLIKKEKPKRCPTPQYSCYIGPYGDVYPLAPYQEMAPLGNISKTPLYDMWNSADLASIRDEMWFNFDINKWKICKNCPFDRINNKFIVQRSRRRAKTGQ